MCWSGVQTSKGLREGMGLTPGRVHRRSDCKGKTQRIGSYYIVDMCLCIDREFRLGEDMYAQDSIELLKQSGIDFAQNEARGIDVQRFGELLMSSGIVLNDEVRNPGRHAHERTC